MDYSFVLESNDDLLTLVEEQLKQNELLENYISESEMLISIYEVQQFMVEQDTQIFMGLKYDFVEEGVMSKIGSAIVNIIKRIRELIMRFINFIKGKISKQKTNNYEKRDNEVSTKDVMDKLDKLAEKFKREAEYEKQHPEETISKLLENIKIEREKLEFRLNEKKYIMITINGNIKSMDTINNLDNINHNLDLVEKILNDINHNKIINYEDSKYNKIIDSVDFEILVNKDKLLNKDEFEKEYEKHYEQKFNPFFNDYHEKCLDNMKYLQEISNNKLKYLEKEINKLNIKNDNYDAIKKIQSIIINISNECSKKIALYTNIEIAYDAWNKNLRHAYNDDKYIENVTSYINKLNNKIDSLKNK